MSNGMVKVIAQTKENGEMEDWHLMMKKKDGKWKCDFMATGEEAARMDK